MSLESEKNHLQINPNFLNIVVSRATINTEKFGTHYYVLEEQCSDMSPLEVKKTVFKFLVSQQGAKWLWACRGVLDQKDLGEAVKQAIEQARWSFGEYNDALLGIKTLLKNINKIAENPTVSELTVEAEDVALVAAGPSLEHQIDSLRNFKGLIIAIDVVMKRLQESGITPHICFSCERVSVTSTTFKGADTSKTLLIAPVVVAPETLAAWEGPVCFYYPNLTYADWMPFKVDKLRVGACVGVAQIGCSFIKISPKNFYLVGHDYAYAPDGGTHSKGLSEVLGDKGLGKKIEVESTRGKCITNNIWDSWANEIEFMYDLHKPKAQVYNLSANGRLLKGTKYLKNLPEGSDKHSIKVTSKSYDAKKRIKKKIKKSLKELEAPLPRTNFNKNMPTPIKSLGFLLFLKDWTRYLSVRTAYPDNLDAHDRWMYRRFKRTRSALKIVLTRALESLC